MAPKDDPEGAAGTPLPQDVLAGRSDEEIVALHTAARGFLAAEWGGALLMALSFIQLYVLIPGPFDVPPGLVLLLGAALLGAGGLVFWRSRAVYHRLGFPYAKKSEFAATVVAGSGVVFWLLFLLLWFLVWRGVDLL